MTVEIKANVTERQIALLRAMAVLKREDISTSCSLTDFIDQDLRALEKDGLCEFWRNGLRQYGFCLSEVGERLLAQIDAASRPKATG